MICRCLPQSPAIRYCMFHPDRTLQITV
jgi:hypothetical protein